jgi:hypothetical protein
MLIKKIYRIGILAILSLILLFSCVNNSQVHNNTLPSISIECKASDWDPYNGTFNLKISYKGTSSSVNVSTLDVIVNNRDVTSLLTINTDSAAGLITGLTNTCDGVNVFATIKDQAGTSTSASCSLPALTIYYPENGSVINDPLPDILLAYDYRTTNSGFSVTMDQTSITGLCQTTTTSASCQKPIGQYITPQGTHSISAHRCFANNGPCCDTSATFTFIPPIPLVTILSPSGYIGSTNANINILFSDTTNKLGLDLNTYNILVDGNNVTNQFSTSINSTLSRYGYSSTPTSFTAQGNIAVSSQTTHTIQASVTDLFYNTIGTASQTFSIDTTPPSLSIVQPISGSTSGSNLPYYIYPSVSLPYQVNYSDTQSGVNPSSFKININGVEGTVSATSISATGILSATLPVSSGSNGTGIYTINATVSDNAGNTATTSSVITLSLANIGIGSASVNTGSTFVVPINVFIDPSYPYGLGSYSIYINFNQSILNFVSVNGSVSGYPGVAYSPQFLNPPSYYLTSSGININSSTTAGGGFAAPVGLFNIANITFYAASPGTTTLTIIVTSMNDTTGAALPSNRVQSGTVTVQ